MAVGGIKHACPFLPREVKGSQVSRKQQRKQQRLVKFKQGKSSVDFIFIYLHNVILKIFNKILMNVYHSSDAPF